MKVIWKEMAHWEVTLDANFPVLFFAGGSVNPIFDLEKFI
jgi:hypothetical protein